MGASFAIQVANNETIAAVNAGATLRNNLTLNSDPRSILQATSNQTVATESKGGSGAEDSESRRTLTSVFGVQAIQNTTEARNLASTTHLKGSLDIEAQLTASETLQAEGQSTGTEKARGLVIAFDMGNNQTHAKIGGEVTTSGPIVVQSTSDATSVVQGKAASKGGDVTPTEGGADKNVADAKKLATDQGAADNGEEPSELKTPEGSVAFAAGLAVGITKNLNDSGTSRCGRYRLRRFDRRSLIRQMERQCQSGCDGGDGRCRRGRNDDEYR